MDVAGFEEFQLDKIQSSFSLESIKKNGKELVLIAAPSEFDVGKLKGELFVENGIISLVNNQDSLEGKQWNLHASEANLDRHLNVLLPSKKEKQHGTGPGFSYHIDVVKAFNLPTITYPKVSKKIKKLPKPNDLSVRWTPFGAGTPFTVTKGETSPLKNKKSKKDKISRDKDDDVIAMSDVPVQQAKKKKKKNREHEGDDNTENNTENKEKKTDQFNSENTIEKKKKKKKKPTKDTTVLSDHEEASPVKKKKKKRSKDEDEEDIATPVKKKKKKDSR